ncbi:high frequency lysogenization protein HflD [Alteromonas sp. KUL49]|uniref:high frequency lysogenization protein HflD n=1 Tax=Alteromonas sp. KUL49 TaxID=2480798 RepID=UPI00102F1A5A|nr:high frequency lysogenization protein HflD [Alteromonas sp. KUL49]TAP36884.1 lysogenization regulator HflD [Alteromonas sp. KUL49]GEA13148.1 high frequency lysogenization protein HflD [Alteromonas sp. KUL49]
MLDKQIEDYLALAGVCQSAALVQQIARRGNVEQDAFEASLSSILVTDPESPQHVFGQLANVKVGYKTLLSQLSDKQGNKDTEITRYIASILGLERKLSRKPDALNELADRISHVQRQLAHVDFNNTQIVGALASIYSDIVSPLAPRIQVAGNPDYLSQPANQQRVRALLLAGVRAAVMWRQMGGQRRQILFRRKQILNSAVKALRLIN